MAGRPPKPLALHIADGTFREDRHGGTANAPGAPEMPAGMEPEAVELWRLVVPELVQLKVVGAIDVTVLRRLCETWVLYRRSLTAANLEPCDKDIRSAVTAYGTRIDFLLNQLGMTPGGRMKLALERGEKPSVARRKRPG